MPRNFPKALNARLFGAPFLGIWGAALLLLAACAASPPPRAPLAGPAPVPAEANPAGDFAAFIADFRAVALAHGISAQTYDRATAGIGPIASIQALNAEQPEFSRPIWDYLDSAVSAQRVADAKRLMDADKAMLARIEARTGVPAEILVAIWGMESDYGRNMGSFPLFSALATLAYAGPRAAYARPEFLAALTIEQQQNYPLGEMNASWAGAFGQTQFTPTTFLKYAVDGDGDGRIDLWQSSADALASAATLRAARGWERGRDWCYEVTLPPGFAYQDADLDDARPLDFWRTRGVTLAGGASLPVTDQTGALYLPAGAAGPAFLVLHNFKVLLKYNNAASYALGVSLLADAARGAPPVQAAWPRQETPLSLSQRKMFQNDLKALGFDPGVVDGVLGRNTRAALRRYQAARGIPADGFPTLDLLNRMNAQLQKK
jgi:membrane-bound lytic murein transglycosylase B